MSTFSDNAAQLGADADDIATRTRLQAPRVAEILNGARPCAREAQLIAMALDTTVAELYNEDP